MNTTVSKHASAMRRMLLLLFFTGMPVIAQQQAFIYGDFTNTFTVAVHEGKFVSIFFHDTNPAVTNLADQLRNPDAHGSEYQRLFAFHLGMAAASVDRQVLSLLR